MTSLAYQNPADGPISARPLSKGAWSKRRDRGKMSYLQYLDFWKKKHPGLMGGSAEPAFAAPPGVFNYATLNKLAGQYFPVQSQAALLGQAKDFVSSQIDPVIKQITDSIGARSKAGSAAITGYSDTFADRLGGIAPAVAASYGQAKSEQAGVDEVLTALIQGRGQEGYQGLAGRLGAAGLPSDVAATIPAAATGAATTTGALGASTLSRLIAQGAAATDTARALPGYARGLGAQELGSFQGMLNQELADQTGALTSQVPGLTQSIYQQLLGRNDAARQGRAGFVNEGLSRALSAWATQAGLSLDYDRMAQDWTQFWAGQANPPGGADAFQWTPDVLADAQATAIQNAISNVLTVPLGQQLVPAEFAGSKYQYLRPRVVNYLRGVLGGMPFKEAQIKAMADQALATVGIRPRKPTDTKPNPSLPQGTSPTRPKPKGHSGAQWFNRDPGSMGRGSGWYVKDANGNWAGVG